MALFGGELGFLTSSGLATDFPDFPEPHFLYIANLAIVGALIGKYIGGYKLEVTGIRLREQDTRSCGL